MPHAVNRLRMRISESQVDMKTHGDEGRNELSLLFCATKLSQQFGCILGVSVPSYLACMSSSRLPVKFHHLPIIRYIMLRGLFLYCKVQIY